MFIVPTGGALAPGSSAVVPFFKPSTLRAPPTSVSVLTASGPVTAPYNLTEDGLAVPASAFIVTVPVTLSTYFKRYSAGGVDSAATWPPAVPWWRRRRELFVRAAARRPFARPTARVHG